MALEASLAAVEERLSSVSSWMRDISERQKTDHDDIIRMQGQISRLESDVRAVRETIEEGLAANHNDFLNYVKRQQEKEHEADKEGRSRNWALILAIVGPFVSAIIGAVTALIAAKGG